MSTQFIITPHDVCDTCNGQSGPKFSLHSLRGISHAHRHNIVPMGVELQSRLDEIRDAQLELDRLEPEVARLRQKLKVIEQRCADLHSFKEQELSLFAPIRSLPDDVLRKIFIICQQDHEDNPGYVNYVNQKTFVRTAMQVSKHWHDTVLSMPALWSRVSFKDNRRTLYPMSIPVTPDEFLEKCLNLSGSMPFSIEFGSSVCTPRNLDDTLLKELAKSASRWEYMTLNDLSSGLVELDQLMKYVPKETVLACLKSLGPASFWDPLTLPSTPALSHLTIMGQHSPITITSAPSLTYLCTVKYGRECLQDQITGFAWSQITHYDCSNEFYGEELHGIINSMPNLLSLTMNLGKTIELSTFTMLPKLETLTFRFAGSAYLGPLKFFITPSLKELNMKGGCDSKLILDMLTRSRCNLEKLTMWGGALLEGKWNIDPLKTVKHLEVWGDYHSRYSKTMEFLTWEATSKSPKRVFSRLEFVRFNFDSIFSFKKHPFPADEFKELVISRLPPKSRPRKTLSYLKSATLKVRAGLKETEGEIINNFRTSEIIQHAKVNVAVEVVDRYG